jgi:hypothetical protein
MLDAGEKERPLGTDCNKTSATIFRHRIFKDLIVESQNQHGFERGLYLSLLAACSSLPTIIVLLIAQCGPGGDTRASPARLSAQK